MSSDSFFFPDKVGILQSHDMPHEFRRDVEASVKMVQNGYELHYEGKEFIADNLDDALSMIRKWMEKFEKTEGRGEEKGNSDHEE